MVGAGVGEGVTVGEDTGVDVGFVVAEGVGAGVSVSSVLPPQEMTAAQNSKNSRRNVILAFIIIRILRLLALICDDYPARNLTFSMKFVNIGLVS